MSTRHGDHKIIGDRYEIIGELGHGGVGKVFKCNDLQLDKIVAVKVLADNNEDLITRFHSEAKLSAKLSNDLIVNVIDFGITRNSEPFLAMEYLDGESLKSRIERLGKIEVFDLLPIAINIASGLAHAHEHGILHRDIKPSNIMLIVREDGTESVKIVDFGIAKKFGLEEQKLTSTGAIIGTPLYLSPEAVEGKKVDVRSEIYSFGCLLFEALTGKAPFQEDSTMMTMMARLERSAPSLNDQSEFGIPDKVCRIVSRCLEREPEKRFSDFQELKKKNYLR